MAPGANSLRWDAQHLPSCSATRTPFRLVGELSCSAHAPEVVWDSTPVTFVAPLGSLGGVDRSLRGGGGAGLRGGNGAPCAGLAVAEGHPAALRTHCSPVQDSCSSGEGYAAASLHVAGTREMPQSPALGQGDVGSSATPAPPAACSSFTGCCTWGWGGEALKAAGNASSTTRHQSLAAIDATAVARQAAPQGASPASTGARKLAGRAKCGLLGARSCQFGPLAHRPPPPPPLLRSGHSTLLARSQASSCSGVRVQSASSTPTPRTPYWDHWSKTKIPSPPPLHPSDARPPQRRGGW